MAAEKVKKPRIDFGPGSSVIDPSDRGEYLHDADPECKHEVYSKWSGVKCRCCPGWFCY